MVRNILKLLCILAVCFMVCSPGEAKRKPPDVIDKYLQDHPDLPEVDKNCIEDGRFEIGITQETLVFLLGEPKSKEVVKQPWAVQEKWVYQQEGRKIFFIEDSHVVGIVEDK